MKRIILVSFVSLVFQSQYAFSEVIGMKKEDWLMRFKPMEVQMLCAKPIIKSTFPGGNQDCSTKLEVLFNKCATQVENVKIPSVLTSRPEAEKYGSIMGECITAYHLGGEYLKTFDQAQAAFAKTAMAKNAMLGPVVDTTVNDAIERFGDISLAWFLNQKCKFLSDELSSELTRNTKVINVSLSFLVDNPEILLAKQESSKKEAESERYTQCPSAAHEIVVNATVSTRSWNKLIRQSTIVGSQFVTAPKVGATK